MLKIIRSSNTCQIQFDDKDSNNTELFQKLDKHLSFQQPGAEFSKAYKGYFNDRGEFVTWDGRKHIMTSAGRFPSGLFQRVIDFYNENGVSPEIIDQRDNLIIAPEIDIAPSLVALKKEPRPYQLEAVEVAIGYERGIIRMATGAGKTLVAALITARLGKPTIIYVIGKDLLYQLKDFFTKIFNTEIGIIGDGKCEIRDINIATVWSVGQALGIKKSVIDDEESKEKKIDPAKFRQIKAMLLAAKVHIMDECHLASCDTVQTIARNIKPDHCYGMSASPWRDDNSDLLIEAFLGQRIVDISARKLIGEGYLVEPDIRFLAPPKYGKKSGKYQTIYSKYVVENEARNAMVVKGATKLVEQGFPTLVLFHSIRHGELLHNAISKNMPVAMLSGEDSSKNREKIKDQLESGEINCIVASKIFDIGIDLPTLSGLVIAGGGKSSVRALQRIGRVIRPNQGKNKAAVIDFADQAPYLIDHAEVRKNIYSWEFNVTWPQEKKSENSAG